MNEEKKRVLKMIEDGKIDAEEGLNLLEALEEPQKTEISPTLRKRFLRVRIASPDGENVNVNLPLGLFKVASKLAVLLPKEAKQELAEQGIDLGELDFDEIIREIEAGLSDGILVDAEVDKRGAGPTQIKVYIE
ncbi:MAG: hypothetical protein GX335_07860 [Firmicutes bacterium]|nr:hypothetical protein [Bacillota bacterium]